MISAEHYYDFYLLLVTVLSVVAFLGYSWYDPYDHRESHNVIPILDILLTFFLILFIGFRDHYAVEFVDTQAYTIWFYHLKETMPSWEWDFDAQNIIFDNLGRFLSFHFDNVSILYIIVAAVNFGGTCYACRKMFPNDSFAMLLVTLGAFTTWGGAINGLKAGDAAALFLVALALDNRSKSFNPFTYIFLALSIGFHHAMRVPVACFVMCKFIKKPHFYTALWLICLIIAALDISYFQELFVGFGEDLDDAKVLGYLGAEAVAEAQQTSQLGISGFRYDFVLYSMVPIVLGWIMMYVKNIRSQNFIFLLNLYTVVNAAWLLCINAAFTNRIAGLSWLMYPFVLMYPYLKETWSRQQYNVFKLVAYCHLGFTLFMHYIYYGK